MRKNEKNKGKVCTTPGHEDRNAKTKGLCSTCDNRQRTARSKICFEQGCTKSSSTGGRCDTDYRRNKKLRKNGWIENGYWTFRVDHPVTLKNGQAKEHRIVAYNKFGPGSHKCHWCPKMLEWMIGEPRHDNKITVDHLDWERLNNHPDNLVLACFECNRTRRQCDVPKSRLVEMEDCW